MNSQKEFEGALAKITFLEEQLHDFQQKHGYLQEELLLTKKETKHTRVSMPASVLHCQREIHKI